MAEGALTAADTELLAGDFAAAEELLRGAYATLEAADETAIRTSVAAALAQALSEQGHDDEALAFTEDSEATAADDDVQAQATWRAVRASVLARRGESDAAARLAAEAVALARGTDDPNLTALALLASGAVDEARALYEAKGAALARLEDAYERRAASRRRASVSTGPHARGRGAVPPGALPAGCSRRVPWPVVRGRAGDARRGGSGPRAAMGAAGTA